MSGKGRGLFMYYLQFAQQRKLNKMKGQSMDGEKIFANSATDKGFLSLIYRQLTQVNNKKNKQNE